MAFKLFRSKSEDVEKDIEIKNTPALTEEEDVLTGEGQLMVDVYQTPTEIVIKSAVAGVKPEDIDISIVNDMITIKGKRELDEEVRANDYFIRSAIGGHLAVQLFCQ